MNHEEVIYKNNDSKLILSGTLTLPNFYEKAPAVILIHGMGPFDRDYNLGKHKLFVVLADYLANKGIAVLRFDKRGVGKSEGKFDLDVTSQDLADDVLAGVEYLKTRKEIDYNKIGLIGLSEGGMIAPMVAAKSKNITFLVLMAGVVTTSIDHNIEHVAMQLRVDGATEKMIEYDSALRRQLFEIIKQETDLCVAEEKLLCLVMQYLNDLPEYLNNEAEKFLFTIDKNNYKEVIKMLNSKWYRFLLSYDPVETLHKIKIPVLAMNGNLDFVVSSKISLPVIAKALKDAGNKNYKTVELPNLNHWFQSCKTGAIKEYGKTKETIAPIALDVIEKWILKQVVDK